MSGQAFYELFVRFVREHGDRAGTEDDAAQLEWGELRERSKALWADIASGLEPRSDTINDRLKKARA